MIRLPDPAQMAHVKYGDQCLAAIMTKTGSGTVVDLVVFDSTGMHFYQEVEFDARGCDAPDFTWHWPRYNYK